MSHPLGRVPNVAALPRLGGIVATPAPIARWPPPGSGAGLDSGPGAARLPPVGTDPVVEATGDALRAAATGR